MSLSCDYGPQSNNSVWECGELLVVVCRVCFYKAVYTGTGSSALMGMLIRFITHGNR